MAQCEMTEAEKDHGVGEIVPDVPEGLEFGLRNYWYPILQTEELPNDKPVGMTVLGEEIAVWRGRDGRPNVVTGHCPHRNAKLSIGRVLDGNLQCLFHGLRFDGGGRCVLIPWEPEDSKLCDELSVRSYRGEELGGYVWAYLGDADMFPPPPLADEVPEELTDADNFVWFKVPTEVWNANWLLTLDGQDAYHVVTLHAQTQAVPPSGGAGGGPDPVPLADRRVKIIDTSYGIRAISTDLDGNALDQGHFTDVKGDRFVLPCLSTNPIRPRPDLDPYIVRVWQIPIDDQSTLVARFLSFRAKSAADRDRMEQFFHEVALPRGSQVSAEDALIAEAQGSLIDARANEYLFNEDIETVKLRRLLKKAFLDQRDGRRMSIAAAALAFPV